MKSLSLLAFSLLSPLAASAATNLACDSGGTGGPLAITITAPNGIDRPETRLNIHSQGMQVMSFDAVVDKVSTLADQQLVVDVTTLGADGQVGPASGQATLTLASQVAADGTRTATGLGSIQIVKRPSGVSPLRLLNHYDLTGCKGSI